MTEGPIDFVAKLQKLREERGEAPPVPQPPSGPPEPTWDQSVLLPDLGGPQLADAEIELDRFVDSITFPQAYNKWIGKMQAVQSKADGNMISCPNPDHLDPPKGNGAGGYNAWFDSDGKWFCGKCQEGGDIHDLAAIHFGYPRPGYKQGEQFHKLRQDMAHSFGFRTTEVAGGKVSWIEPVPDNPPPTGPGLHAVGGSAVEAAAEASAAADGDSESNEADVAHMWADDDEGEDLVLYPTIDWQNIIPEDTFLYEYMKACTNDDAPEEYHFWHGLLALGLVCGRNVTLDDTQPVYGNLLLCVLGQTGTGKSRSRRHLNHVLKETAPYREDGTRTTGVKLVPVPGSGEHLIKEFTYEGKDPTNGTRSLGPQRVTGLVDFDEMSALLARANRQGATLKPTIMQFADAVPDVMIGSLMRGNFHAYEPFCTITASTQPKAIRTLLSRADTGSGFLNRWVFAGGKTKQIEALGGSRSHITVDLATAVEELKKVRGWGAITRSIRMDDDAYEAYVRFFRARIEPAKLKDETDLLKRIDLISKKLMLLLTINLRLESVPMQVVQAMIELFDYVLECYGILNSNIGVTLMQDVMNEIERHISRHYQKTGRGASARDIARYTARKNYTLEQIKKALEVMKSLDIIDLEKPQSSMGRPTIRYKVVGE